MAKRRADPEAADRIIHAAIALWAEKGYAATTMRELGRRVGMSASSLYATFRSKEEIAQALYARLNAQALEEAETVQGSGLAEQVAGFLHIKLRILAQHRAVLPTLLREAVDPASAISPLASASDGVRATVVGHFQALIHAAHDAPAGEPERLARLLWAGHMAIILYFCHDTSNNYTLSHALVDRVCEGMGLLALLPNLPGAQQILEIVDAVLDPKPVDTRVTVDTPPASDRQVDVLVVGAGPIGCVLAGFIKKRRPTCRVLVVDKQTEPTHKIGESTLSGFCKALRTLGVPHHAMQTLFHRKNGLGFFHVDEGVSDVQRAPEYILETFDETFQVERRPLELMLHQMLERLGVELLLGADAKLADAKLSVNDCVVDVQIGEMVQRVAARHVVDATGPASTLAKRFDLWTSDGPPFQTSASWSYWTGVVPLGDRVGWSRASQFPRQEYTQHLCFREGWVWVIPLVSWQSAPTRNLDRLVREVTTGKSEHDRATVSARFGCPTQPLTSVGLVLRNDRDQRADPRDALAHYRKKYPAVDSLIGQGVQVEAYGSGQPSQRRRMRGHARKVAGEGWMLVGNAAFFVDPLISPGLTAGAACAWQAAKAIDALLNGDTEAGDAYQRYVHALHEAHERDNQLVYMSFNHPSALSLVQRMQEVDARRHFLVNDKSDYDEVDTNVWGILDPHYQTLQRDAWQILRDAERSVQASVPIEEQCKGDYDDAVMALKRRLSSHLEQHRSLTPYVQLHGGAA